MSLLRDIQNSAIDNKTDITTLLRKCKVLSARLGNKKFKDWVESELNGYKENTDLPSYRILSVNSKGDFAGFAGSGLRNADIPINNLPKEARELFSHSYLRFPISSYTSLIENSNGESFKEPWLPDFVAYVASDIYEDMNCLSAWKVIPNNSIVCMIDSVRNKILNFVLEIEEENPEAGEATKDSRPIPDERVTQIFNTNISGDVHNLASGNTNVTQNVELNIYKNLDNLIAELRQHNIPEEDLRELRTAIEQDDKDSPNADKIGDRVTSWMTNMFKKASSGALNVGVSVATTIITKAICEYYGIS